MAVAVLNAYLLSVRTRKLPLRNSAGHPLVCHGQTQVSIARPKAAREISHRQGELGSGGRGGEAVRLAPQNRVEARPAEILAACFFVENRDSADVAAENRPDSADHRMPSLPVREEVVQELAQHRPASFGAQAAS